MIIETDDPVLREIYLILQKDGPKLGKELSEALPDVSQLKLWQSCFTDEFMQISHFASYYLRYDITRNDEVRLSPSILRDFLSFTLFALPQQRRQVVERQAALSNKHRNISLEKLRIARQVIKSLLVQMPDEAHKRFCTFIAGDLSYFLAHSEPREVESIGEMVFGSDIDIIIVHEDLDDSIIEMIEAEMMSRKNYYLRHPKHRQELDYICKPKSKMFRQFRYGDIHEKIASKIVYESMFLGGSLELYMSIRDELVASGTQDLIEVDFEDALAKRKAAMKTLLNAPDILDDNTKSLFFFSQERVEFT